MTANGHFSKRQVSATKAAKHLRCEANEVEELFESRKRRRTESLSSQSDSSMSSRHEDDDLQNEQPETSGTQAPTDAPNVAIPDTIAQARNKASLASRTSFATLGVAPWLVASLSAMQVKRPTIIQAGCIPEIINGRDCIGGSRTGSGKTIAFAVPILHRWALDPTGIYAVILTPTRYVSSDMEIFNIQ